MKRFLSLAGGVIAIVIGVAVATGMFREPAQNPDPNHTHADFAIWVLSTKLDFSDDRYMSAPPAAVDTSFQFIPSAFAHEEEAGEEALPGRQYLHLHDGIGNVIHRHKPELTLNDFFLSIGLDMHSDCLTIDDFLLSQIPAAERETWALTTELCNSGKFRWTMVVNGTVTPMNPDYEFQDGDKILLSYESSDTAWQQQWEDMTDDACLYSRTCPWRGDPPAENCIADPEVPCVIPVE